MGGRRSRTHHQTMGGKAMNASVQGALEKAQEKLQAQEKAQRDALALYFDLYTREYAPDGKFSAEYCFYSSKDETPRYFRKVPQPLTDGEAQALQAARAELDASAPQTRSAPEAKTRITGIGAVLRPLAVGIGILTAAICVIFILFAPAFDEWSIVFVSVIAIYGSFAALLLAALGDALHWLQTIAGHLRQGE